jgi:WD40 repeat protein
LFNKDGSLLVLANHWIVGFDIAKGQVAWELPGHLEGRPVNSMALSADESILATVTQEEAIVWDLKKKKDTITIKTWKKQGDASNNCVAISPDATRLVTGSRDGFFVWDIATGRKLRSFPGLPTAAILWTSDGRCLITLNNPYDKRGFESGCVNIWGIEGANTKLEARTVTSKSPSDLHAINWVTGER